MHKTLSGLGAVAALFVLAGTGSGYQLARDAVPGCGGSGSGGGYTAAWSAGIPLAGTAAAGGYEETVGFWRPILPGVSDAPDGATPEALPEFTALVPSRPNPFGSHAVLRFQIAGDAGPATPVRLEIFDVIGRSLRVLVDEPMPAGFFEVTWDRTDGTGARAANGIYFARLQTPRYTKSIRLVAAR